MAKKRKKENALPNLGDVFLMPLEDGRFGVCRVIQKGLQDGRERVLVAASPWIGSGRPDLSEPLLREILLLNHHAWKNALVVLWTSAPVLADFTWIGLLEPAQNETQMYCHASGGWQWMSAQVLAQWRWDNDREAALKEDEKIIERKSGGRKQTPAVARNIWPR